MTEAGRPHRIIGCITTTVKDANAILRVAEPSLPSWATIGIGLLVGDKTINDRLILPRWQRFCVRQEDARMMHRFIAPPRSVLILHVFTRAIDSAMITNDLEAIMEWCGQRPDYLQLDLCWPNRGIIETLYHRHPTVRCILQIDGSARRAYAGKPTSCVKAMKDTLYGDLLGGPISHLLWGGSASAGAPFSPADAYEFIRAIQDTIPDVEPMVTGALGPTRLGHLEDLASRFPSKKAPCSVDAESELAPDYRSPPCPDRTADYLSQAHPLLCSP